MPKEREGACQALLPGVNEHSTVSAILLVLMRCYCNSTISYCIRLWIYSVFLVNCLPVRSAQYQVCVNFIT